MTDQQFDLLMKRFDALEQNQRDHYRQHSEENLAAKVAALQAVVAEREKRTVTYKQMLAWVLGGGGGSVAVAHGLWQVLS